MGINSITNPVRLAELEGFADELGRAADASVLVPEVYETLNAVRSFLVANEGEILDSGSVQLSSGEHTDVVLNPETDTIVLYNTNNTLTISCGDKKNPFSIELSTFDQQTGYQIDFRYGVVSIDGLELYAWTIRGPLTNTGSLDLFNAGISNLLPNIDDKIS